MSVSYIHQPERTVPVHPDDGFIFLFPFSDFLPYQLCQLQVERMLSDISSPRPRDINFWKEKIASFAIDAAIAVLCEGYHGFTLLVDFTISTDPAQIVDEIFMLDDEYSGETERSEELLRLLFYSEAAAGLTGELGAVPSSEDSIKELESKTYQGDGKDGSTCAICLEDFVVGAELTVMPCSHEFHQSCATAWLEQSQTCPLCRCAMPTV